MSAAHNDGGPAFPSHFNTAVREGMGGMTLRDYFAAKALHNILGCGHQPNYEIAAADAYSYADAMLKARSA